MFGGSKKNTQSPGQQEMIQVGMLPYITEEEYHEPRANSLGGDTDRSDSSFWRSRSSNTTPVSNRNDSGFVSLSQEPPRVVGASYSYTDMLKFGELSSSGRPKTPTSSSSSTLHSTHSKKADFSDFMVQTDDDWDADLGDPTGGRDNGMLGSGLAAMTGLSKVKSIEGKPTPNKGFGDSPGKAAGGVSGPGIWEYPTTKKKVKGLKAQFEGLVRDPANSLHMIYHPPISANTHTSAEIEAINARISRINKFKTILQSSSVDLAKLRELAWSGIPDELRPMAWQLLLGYLPANSERRVTTLERKRKEFFDGVKQAFSRGKQGMDQTIWHQVSIDVPRTNPHIPLYGYATTQKCLEKILYVWAIRHPASGYVQGINDLVTPFWQVFLSAYIDEEVETFDPGSLPQEVLDVVSADSFWCLTKLLDGIQDNYIHSQPGIQRQVTNLRDLTARIDAPLSAHLHEVGVEFIQFSFRWMNCMLMREVSVKNTIRMWDTYMSEGPSGFSEFHLYVCAAFLVKWTDELKKMDFQEVMMFLQSLPTKAWGEKEITMLLSEAFIWKSLFSNSSAHLRNGSASTPTRQLQL